MSYPPLNFCECGTIPGFDSNLGEENSHFVQCFSCWVQTGSYETRKKAVLAWNNDQLQVSPLKAERVKFSLDKLIADHIENTDKRLKEVVTQ